MFRLVPYQVPTSVPSAAKPSSTVSMIATAGTTEPRWSSISRTHAPRARRAGPHGDECCPHASSLVCDPSPGGEIFNIHRSISLEPIIGGLISRFLFGETGLSLQRD